MDNSTRKRGRAVAAMVAAASVGLSMSAVVRMALAAPPEKSLPKMTVELPRDVLIFPASVSAGSGDAAGQMSPSAKQAQELVTNAFRNKLGQAGIGVVVYNKRLPSIQRSVAEGSIKAEQAAAGPGDDPRASLQLATLAGAAEYLTIDVQNYKYDANTRTATFNVSVERNSAETGGAALATVAKPAVGTAPADVSMAHQEGSAVAHASEQLADEVFQDLYPQIAQMQEAKMMKSAPASKKK